MAAWGSVITASPLGLFVVVRVCQLPGNNDVEYSTVTACPGDVVTSKLNDPSAFTLALLPLTLGGELLVDPPVVVRKNWVAVAR